MIGRFRTFAWAVYDFVVGDDWLAAVGVVLAIACTAGLAHSGVNAWWLLPASVVVLLGLSLRRASRG